MASGRVESDWEGFAWVTTLGSSSYVLCTERAIAKAATNAPKYVEPWLGAYKTSCALDAEMTVWRVHSTAEAAERGFWLVVERPASGQMAKELCALPESNAAMWISKVRLPPGTQVEYGWAAKAFGRSGGDVQVRLLHEIEGACRGKAIPLK
jgi:hypothetical protein